MRRRNDNAVVIPDLIRDPWIAGQARNDNAKVFECIQEGNI
jgi:hypothetical protein